MDDDPSKKTADDPSKKTANDPREIDLQINDTLTEPMMTELTNIPSNVVSHARLDGKLRDQTSSEMTAITDRMKHASTGEATVKMTTEVVLHKLQASNTLFQNFDIIINGPFVRGENHEVQLQSANETLMLSSKSTTNTKANDNGDH